MIVHIIRTNRIPFFQSAPSMPLLFGTLVVMGLGACLPYSIFADKLGFFPLPPILWVWIVGFLIAYAFLCHAMKVWFYKKFGAD